MKNSNEKITGKITLKDLNKISLAKERSARKKKKQYSSLEALEPRILFDASVVSVAHHLIDALSTHHNTDSHHSNFSHQTHKEAPHEAQPVTTPVTAANLHDFNAFRDAQIHNQPTGAPGTPWDLAHHAIMDGANDSSAKATGIIFIDAGYIGNTAKILHQSHSNIEIVWLDHNQDGFSQITNTLQGMHNVSSVYLITNLDSTSSVFGNGALSQHSLDSHAQEIQSWSTDLSQHANFVIYDKNAMFDSINQSVFKDFANLINTNVTITNSLRETYHLHDQSTHDTSSHTTDNSNGDGHHNPYDKTHNYSTHSNDYSSHTNIYNSTINSSTINFPNDQNAINNQEIYTQSFSVHISGIVHYSDTVSVPAGTPTYTPILNAADVGSEITYSLSGQDASYVQIDPSGAVRFLALPDFAAKDNYNFTIDAFNSQGLHAAEQVHINVADIPPQFVSPPTLYVTDGTPASTHIYDLLAVIPAGGTVNYSISGPDASAFSVDPTSGALTLTSNANLAQKANYQLTVTASDPFGASSTQNLTVDVTSTPVQNPPLPKVDPATFMFIDPTVHVKEGTSAATELNYRHGPGVTFTITDQNGLTYNPATGTDPNALFVSDSYNSNGVSTTGNLYFNSSDFPNGPDYDVSNTYTVTVRGYNALGVLQSTTIITVDIKPDNSLSFSAAGTQSMNEGISQGTLIFNAGVTDPGYGASSSSGVPDQDPTGDLTYTLSGTDASDFAVDSSGNVIWALSTPPVFSVQKTYKITVNVSDTGDPSSTYGSKNFKIDVNDVPPVITSPANMDVVTNPTSGIAKGTDIYTVMTSYTGGGTLTYSLSSNPHSDFAINASSGTITSNKILSASATDYPIVVSVKDAPSHAVTQDVHIYTVAFTSGTTGNSINSYSNTGQTVYTATVEDLNAVTYSLSGSDASDFSINTNTGVVTNIISPNYALDPSFSFNVIATDAYGSFSQGITVAVNNVSPPPNPTSTINSPNSTNISPIVNLNNFASSDTVTPSSAAQIGMNESTSGISGFLNAAREIAQTNRGHPYHSFLNANGYSILEKGSLGSLLNNKNIGSFAQGINRTVSENIEGTQHFAFSFAAESVIVTNVVIHIPHSIFKDGAAFSTPEYGIRLMPSDSHLTMTHSELIHYSQALTGKVVVAAVFYPPGSGEKTGSNESDPGNSSTDKDKSTHLHSSVETLLSDFGLKDK